MTKALIIDDSMHRVKSQLRVSRLCTDTTTRNLFPVHPDLERSREDCRKVSLLKEIGQGRDIAIVCLYLVVNALYGINNECVGWIRVNMWLMLYTVSTMNVSGGYELTRGYNH